MIQKNRVFRVLLVEDDPGDAGLIRRALRDKRFGVFECVWVSTLAEALEKLAEERFDVMLLDLSLPDSSGQDTVRAGLVGAGGIPLVVLTGRDDADFALGVLDLGAQDYLVKGAFDDDVLIRALRYALARSQAEQALRENRELLQAITDSAKDAIFMMDFEERISFWNPAAQLLFQYAPEEALGHSLVDLVAPRRFLEMYTQAFSSFQNIGPGADRGQTMELPARRKDGSEVPVELSLSAFRNRQGWYAVGVARDITQRKEAEEKLILLATTDPLTGLFNRRSFMEAMEQELGRFRRYGKAPALMMLDLDHFKRINDTHGHAGGDEVLQSFAGTLKEQLRETDLPGRLGGEEFAVLLPETGLESALRIAWRILNKVRSTPVQIQTVPVAFTVSIGVGVMLENDANPDAILARADAALYRAKNGGRDRVEAG